MISRPAKTAIVSSESVQTPRRGSWDTYVFYAKTTKERIARILPKETFKNQTDFMEGKENEIRRNLGLNDVFTDLLLSVYN
jgi:hypothetical protein